MTTEYNGWRVWAKNMDETVHCLTNWLSYAQCKTFILNRWNHHPPFACISKARTTKSFLEYYGRRGNFIGYKRRKNK